MTKRCITAAAPVPARPTPTYSAAAVSNGHHDTIRVWAKASPAPITAASSSARNAGIITVTSALVAP